MVIKQYEPHDLNSSDLEILDHILRKSQWLSKKDIIPLFINTATNTETLMKQDNYITARIKNNNFSNCGLLLITNNYKKGGTICRIRYNQYANE